MRPIQGNLTVGTAAVKTRVMCVRIPDMSPWKTDRGNKLTVQLPELNKKYTISANVFSPHYQGVRLQEVKNKEKGKYDGKGDLEEPVFPYDCFLVLSNN